VVINKGSANGVYKGQPVLDNRGILGQVMSVGHTTARVLLNSDQSHSLSLRAERNDIRVLARGTGDLQRLELMFIPHSTELEVGDKLMSSGLGGVFPPGDPVAEIIEVNRDERYQYARVTARPYAQLARIRTVLLLWPPSAVEQPVYDDVEVDENVD